MNLPAVKRLFGPTVITASAASIYAPTLASNGVAVVRCLQWGNQHTLDVAFSLYLVPSGASATASNLIIPAVNVKTASWDMAESEELFVLQSGDALWALATVASKIVVIGNGYEQ